VVFGAHAEMISTMITIKQNRLNFLRIESSFFFC
jgi:hypothetical protein